MCCKCLYGLLFVVLLILFYLFISPEDWASWVTALSTLAMAIFAWRALYTWKNELKAKRIIDTYNKIYELSFNIANFLDNYAILKEKEGYEKLNQQLDVFQSKLKLIQSEIKIIGNIKLLQHINYCVENIKSTFIIQKELKDDDSYEVTAWPESFVSRFLNNSEFNQTLRNNINDIKQICEQEQLKFYK